MASQKEGANAGISPKTHSLALLNRRALLNVAMLLRNSEVARQVRHYLLNVEELTDDEIRQAAVARRNERVEYRQFRDMLSETASNYAPGNTETRIAFGKVQNALYRSVTGLTANQLKASTREIQTWTGKRGPTAADRDIAKNFLTLEAPTARVPAVR